MGLRRTSPDIPTLYCTYINTYVTNPGRPYALNTKQRDEYKYICNTLPFIYLYISSKIQQNRLAPSAAVTHCFMHYVCIVQVRIILHYLSNTHTHTPAPPNPISHSTKKNKNKNKTPLKSKKIKQLYKIAENLFWRL